MQKSIFVIISIVLLLLSGCSNTSIALVPENTSVSISNAILNTTITSPVDLSTGSLQTIDYAHHEIHSGSHYFVLGFLDLALNEVLDITWKQPNTTTWTHFTWLVETESEYEWYIYEDVTPINDLSTLITIHNNNRNSNKTSNTTMRYEIFSSLTNANIDTNITGATGLKRGIIGSGKQLGGDFNRENELILKQGSTYLLRGIAKGAGYITFDMEWYEHTNK